LPKVRETLLQKQVWLLVNFNQSKNITWNFIFLWDCKKTKKTNSRFKNGDNFFLSAQHIHASFYYAIWQIILQSGPNSNNNNNAYFINEEEQRLRNAAINSIRKMRHQPGKTKDSFLITLLQQLIRFQQCSSYFSWLILLLHYLEVIFCLMSEWVKKETCSLVNSFGFRPRYLSDMKVWYVTRGTKFEFDTYPLAPYSI